MAISAPSSLLSTIFFNKVQQALSYDSWNRNNLKITIDIYNEEGVRNWAKFLGLKGDLLDLEFVHKKLCSKKQTRVFWKHRYSSVREIPGVEVGWWIRHHGQFRTVVLVKKREDLTDSDPGIELSLWGCSVCSYQSNDLGEEDIIEESKRVSTTYYLSIKITTRLLQNDDPFALQQLYTGE